MEEIVKRLEAGETIKQIAESCGVTRYVIEQKLASHGIRPREFVSNMRRKRMMELRNQGLSNRQIAKEIGCCPSSVRDYIGLQGSSTRNNFNGVNFVINTLWDVPSLARRINNV